MITRNINILKGAAILEIMWNNNQKDIVDIISPLIKYAIVKNTASYKIVNYDEVLSYVASEFGYKNMPRSIIEIVMKRDRQHFRRDNKKYTYLGGLDNEITEIDKRKSDCDIKINAICSELMNYLNSNSIRKKFNLDETINCLQNYISEKAFTLCDNDVSAGLLDSKQINFHIAEFILDKKQEHSLLYDYILDLLKGSLLENAIYMNPVDISINYSKVDFYYDTTFLLQLLGYKNKEDADCAKELHDLLKDKKGNFYYFNQTNDEILGILTAYRNSLNKNINPIVTLEGLDEKGYTYGGVDRLIQGYKSNLSVNYSISIKDTPTFEKDESGAVIDKCLLDEYGIKQYIQTKIPNYQETNLYSDILSLQSIYKLRSGVFPDRFEDCKAIFVTTNNSLEEVFNDYYKYTMNGHGIPLVISDSELSTIAWIQSGKKSDLPEKILLRNAYMALTPNSELLKEFKTVVNQMKDENSLSDEESTALLTTRFIQKELLKHSFESGEVNRDFVENAKSLLKEEYIKEEKENSKKEQDNIYKQEYETMVKNAKLYMEEKKNSIFHIVYTFLRLIILVLFTIIAFTMIFKCFKEMTEITFATILVLAFEIYSLTNDGISEKIRIKQFSEKLANIYANKKFAEKLSEYRKNLSDENPYKNEEIN